MDRDSEGSGPGQAAHGPAWAHVDQCFTDRYAVSQFGVKEV